MGGPGEKGVVLGKRGLSWERQIGPGRERFDLGESGLTWERVGCPEREGCRGDYDSTQAKIRTKLLDDRPFSYLTCHV